MLRGLAVGMVAALAMLMAIAPSAHGDPTLPGGTFVDDDGSVHEGAIEAVATAQITLGCDPVGPRYCPGRVVTRGQMASFLARTLGLDTNAPDRFDDDDGSVHEAAINAIAAAEITLGCGDTTFCPSAPVSRSQMAAFLVRAFDFETPESGDRFTDDDGSLFEEEIEAIAAAGVTVGCDPAGTRFCPLAGVRRDQMATFIARAVPLALLVPPPRAPVEERLLVDHAELMLFGPREAGTESEMAAIDWVASRAAAAVGWSQQVDVPLPNGRTSANVWTTVGTGPIEVLLGAHIDSVPGSPGADDNGSGVVVLLESMRAFIADPNPALTVTFVWFGAEERLDGFGADVHHLGSRLMAESLSAEGALPDWMYSIDMVGLGEEIWAVTYEDTDSSAADLAAGAAGTVGVSMPVVSRGDISDHEAFARAGVPAAFLWRPDNPAWHTPDDTVVSIEALVEDVAIVAALLDALTGLPAN